MEEVVNICMPILFIIAFCIFSRVVDRLGDIALAITELINTADRYERAQPSVMTGETEEEK